MYFNIHINFTITPITYITTQLVYYTDVNPFLTPANVQLASQYTVRKPILQTPKVQTKDLTPKTTPTQSKYQFKFIVFMRPKNIAIRHPETQ